MPKILRKFALLSLLTSVFLTASPAHANLAVIPALPNAWRNTRLEIFRPARSFPVPVRSREKKSSAVAEQLNQLRALRYLMRCA